MALQAFTRQAEMDSASRRPGCRLGARKEQPVTRLAPALIAVSLTAIAVCVLTLSLQLIGAM